jgi:hypothetical protein
LKIFDPNPVVAGFVETWFIAYDHAGLKRRRASTDRDSMWTFVNRKIAPNAVAGAVSVVEAAVPERSAGERIEVGAIGAGRERYP